MRTRAEQMVKVFNDVGDMSLADFISYLRLNRHFKGFTGRDECIFDDNSRIIIFNGNVLALD